MSFTRLIWQSFRQYLKRNLLVMFGVALSTAVLTGALFIGDSMRHSLEQITLSRLGSITYLVSVNDRYFRAELADEISIKAGCKIAPVLMESGSAVSNGGQRRVNNIRFVGTDARFEAISGTDIFNDIPENEIIISENLADQLGVKPGDALLLRIARASLMPLNTPFVSDAETTVPLRATISSIATRNQMGGFNLKNSQSSPFNVFLSLDRLNKLMGFSKRANRLLVSGKSDTGTLAEALNRCLKPEDAGLIYQEIPGTGETEISSERIFLDQSSSALFSSLPGSRSILTYFVNSIEFNGKEVPYSFVSSWSSIPLSSGEIIVNDWVAGDLGVKVGDTLKISYFEIGPLRQLKEKSVRLRLRKVVPISGNYGDRALIPRIPGLSDAGHCREWEAGVPIRLDKIRPKDEDYWNKFRGTPKAFVSADLASRLWSNRFGNITAIRIPSASFSESEYRKLFSGGCNASELGFSIHAVREEGLAAAKKGVDFGQLFLGLSFFLLLSSIILTSLLFRLNLENRRYQTGTLMQLGFTKRQISRIFLSEGLAIAIPGVVLGVLLAIVYVMVIFAFLNTLWWDIVRTPVIFLKIKSLTLVFGMMISLVISLISVWIPLRRFLKKEISSLQQRHAEKPGIRFLKASGIIVLFLIGAAIIIVAFQFINGRNLNPALFFLSGGLLLIGFLLLFVLWLAKPDFPEEIQAGSALSAKRRFTLNRNRSLSVVMLFAISTFIVISTGANRQNIFAIAGNKESGTGGFGYFAETSVPVLYDLNDRNKRMAEGLDSSFHIVQFHIIEGDDASCLNLNRVSNPSILGFNPEEFRGHFSFETATADLDKDDPWSSLRKKLPGGIVPAIADQTVIQYGLGMKTGDTLRYQAETGDTLRLKLIGGLAPSVFQGYVLIDNASFLRYYPSTSGSSVFLVDSQDDNVREELSSLLRDNGIEISSAPQKLAGFHSVTNTYLSIFLALGALGLVIGTIGISIIVARTLLERRREFAIMLAIGFKKKDIVFQLFTEYSFLLAIGMGIGLASAVISLFPVFLSGNNAVTTGFILVLFFGIIMNGLFWIAGLASALVVPRRILTALHDI